MGRRRGRPRKDSTSTVATVDDNQIRYAKESDLLKPIPAGLHSDRWPCFSLDDVVVYHKDGRTPANLLHVASEGPFIVRGRLDLTEDEDTEYLRESRFSVPFVYIRLLMSAAGSNIYDRQPYVEIQQAVSFSIALTDEGMSGTIIWASGQAGWFEITPAEEYRKIYNTMDQGVALYYNILLQYEDHEEKRIKKSKKGKASHQVLVEPALEALFHKVQPPP